MENIKDYLERANTEHWEYLKKNPPAFLDKVGEEITTEKMQEVIEEDVKNFSTLDSILDKLDRCLAMQEKNIKTLEYINEILTT